MSTKHTVKKTEIARRRYDLTGLILEGVRDRSELARRLGVTERTVYRDLEALYGEWQNEGRSIIGNERDQERLISAMRLERVVRLIEPDLHDPERRITAGRLVKEVEERRSKLLGLDMPTKVAPTDPSGRDEYEGIRFSSAFRQRMIEAGYDAEAEVVEDSG